MSTGLLIKCLEGLKSAFAILEGERSRRPRNPLPWTGTGDASSSDSRPYRALETLLGHSGWRSPQHLSYPGWRLGHLRQRHPLR